MQTSLKLKRICILKMMSIYQEFREAEESIWNSLNEQGVRYVIQNKKR